MITLSFEDPTGNIQSVELLSRQQAQTFEFKVGDAQLAARNVGRLRAVFAKGFTVKRGADGIGGLLKVGGSLDCFRLDLATGCAGLWGLAPCTWGIQLLGSNDSYKMGFSWRLLNEMSATLTALGAFNTVHDDVLRLEGSTDALISMCRAYGWNYELEGDGYPMVIWDRYFVIRSKLDSTGAQLLKLKVRTPNGSTYK